MKKSFLIVLTALLVCNSFSQSTLTIEKIMQGEKFTGYSPENLRWSVDGKKLYFSWNPGMELLRSDYIFRPGDKNPVKASLAELKQQPPVNASYNHDRSKAVWSQDGDIWMMDIKSGQASRILSSVAPESGPEFSMNDDKIIYISQSNIFTREISTGIINQLTDIRIGKDRGETAGGTNERDTWLSNDELRLIKTLVERKQLREAEKKASEEVRLSRPKPVYTGSGMVSSLKLSPDQNYVTFISYKPSDEKRTIVPSYVNESGYTEDIPARAKVGSSAYSSGTLNIYDLAKDTIYQAKADNLPGIADQPDYIKDYPSRKQDKKSKRGLSLSSPVWSGDGKMAVVDIISDDHKDRWITLLDVRTGDLKTLDRQRDEAWIGGPGIGRGSIGWLPDNRTVYFQSEESGFSHLYTVDAVSGTKKALTSGQYEINDLRLSNDGKTWYFISNEPDQGIRELYRMPVNGGQAATRLTNFNGGVEYELSSDEKYFALRVSTATIPWELYILENRKDAKPVKITESATDEFRAYNWKTPEFIRIKASDGAMVPARLYKPVIQKKGGKAVIFVHGAGYLQNAHRWWSSYFREYMFHNFLVDNGYTVLDIDYRGSSGYGRDWRTAIYRHMGGRDLDDHVDAARYLIDQEQVDPGKIGIYGGSYGGFITLMALFTKPGVFRAGAALRPVTDWAHYNHGYTSNILNTPVQDSLAYIRSSPIYYAEGLKDNLLICHGMVDDNVHFQDVVRLSQRLIELGKDNWSLAAYPLESHSFVETSSWVDEYKRIFRLFEDSLK